MEISFWNRFGSRLDAGRGRDASGQTLPADRVPQVPGPLPDVEPGPGLQRAEYKHPSTHKLRAPDPPGLDSSTRRLLVRVRPSLRPLYRGGSF